MLHSGSVHCGRLSRSRVGSVRDGSHTFREREHLGSGHAVTVGEHGGVLVEVHLGGRMQRVVDVRALPKGGVGRHLGGCGGN